MSPITQENLDRIIAGDVIKHLEFGNLYKVTGRARRGGYDNAIICGDRNFFTPNTKHGWEKSFINKWTIIFNKQAHFNSLYEKLQRN